MSCIFVLFNRRASYSVSDFRQLI